MRKTFFWRTHFSVFSKTFLMPEKSLGFYWAFAVKSQTKVFGSSERMKWKLPFYVGNAFEWDFPISKWSKLTKLIDKIIFKLDQFSNRFICFLLKFFTDIDTLIRNRHLTILQYWTYLYCLAILITKCQYKRKLNYMHYRI